MQEINSRKLSLRDLQQCHQLPSRHPMQRHQKLESVNTMQNVLVPSAAKDEGNLKGHLKSHAKKGLIEENQVDKLVAVAIHQGKTRGPGRASHNKTKKGLKLKWCPVEDCSTVTHYLRSHLTHFHHMKPGELFNTHLKVARHYQGSAEVTAIQEMIRSMSSQVKKPVATSTTTNTSEFTTNPSASSPSTSIADLPASDPSCKNES